MTEIQNVMPVLTGREQTTGNTSPSAVNMFERFVYALSDGANEATDVRFSLNFNIKDGDILSPYAIKNRQGFFDIFAVQIDLIVVGLRDVLVFEVGGEVDAVLCNFDRTTGKVIFTSLIFEEDASVESKYRNLEKLVGVVHTQKLIARYNQHNWDRSSVYIQKEHKIPFYTPGWEHTLPSLEE